MTDHKVGTPDECLTARLKLLEAEKRIPGAATSCQDAPGTALGRIDKEYRFNTIKARRHSRTCSQGARSCSSTTSCSAPNTRLVARLVQP